MSVQSFSDFVYSIKEKITDQEYMDVMNMLKELNIKKEADKKYKFVLLCPTVITDYDTNEDVNFKREFSMTRHRVINRKIEFISKITECSKQKHTAKPSWCHYCSCHPDKNKCMYVDNMKANMKREFPSIKINSLLNICDENIHGLLQYVEYCMIHNNIVENIYVEEYENDEDDDEEETKISPYRKSYNKKVNYDSIHLDIEITLVSINEVV